MTLSSNRTLTKATAVLALAAGAPALAQQVSPADLERMMAVIEAQQAQIDAMRAELDAMLAAQGAPARSTAQAASAPASVAVSQAETGPLNLDDRTEAQMVEEGFTWRDQSGRSLTLSGQVNPAFNVVSDGISTEVFIVDNDTSGTRFRLDADAPLGETSFGATIEIAASPNNSYDVSQLNPDSGADYNVRRAEVTIRDDRYGRLQLVKHPAHGLCLVSLDRAVLEEVLATRGAPGERGLLVAMGPGFCAEMVLLEW